MGYACIESDVQRNLIAALAGEYRADELNLTFAFDGESWRTATACRKKWKADDIEMAVNNFG